MIKARHDGWIFKNLKPGDKVTFYTADEFFAHEAENKKSEDYRDWLLDYSMYECNPDVMNSGKTFIVKDCKLRKYNDYFTLLVDVVDYNYSPDTIKTINGRPVDETK